MKEEIGKRIKNARENMHMTKESFAKEIGITGQYLGILEKGQSYLSVEKLKKLCDLTGLSADYILFGITITIAHDTQKVLSGFSDEQIANACNTLKDLALLIKNA